MKMDGVIMMRGITQRHGRQLTHAQDEIEVMTHD